MSARGVALVGGVLLLAGCTGHGATRPDTARSPRPPLTGDRAAAVNALCVAALPHEVVVSAASGAAADVRLLIVGPAFQPSFPDAFPEATPTAPVTWCWTRNSTSSFTAWATGPGTTTIVKLVTVNGVVRAPPSGPPVLL
jgi:hypothetical protein